MATTMLPLMADGNATITCCTQDGDIKRIPVGALENLFGDEPVSVNFKTDHENGLQIHLNISDAKRRDFEAQAFEGSRLGCEKL